MLGGEQRDAGELGLNSQLNRSILKKTRFFNDVRNLK